MESELRVVGGARVQTRSRRSYLSDAGALYNLTTQVSRRRRPRCLL